MTDALMTLPLLAPTAVPAGRRATPAPEPWPEETRTGRMTIPVVLADFQPIELTPPVAQDTLARYLGHLLTLAHCVQHGISDAHERHAVAQRVQARVEKYGVSTQHIGRRQVTGQCAAVGTWQGADDRASLPITHSRLLQDPAGDTIDARMKRYKELAGEIFDRCYPAGQATPPDDLIHVTCTGYVGPSPANVLVSTRGWYDTAITHSYHMGCYGAFPAIRTALGLIGSSYVALPRPKTRVDIVHTELISLHLNLLAQAPWDLIAATLFADGFIKYSAYPGPLFSRSNKRGLRIVNLLEQHIADSTQAMTWTPGPHQYDLYLSRMLPLRIRDEVAGFVRALCAPAGIDFEREKEDLVFAIHPGGPAILDHIRDELGLDESQLSLSRQVLYDYGNMSSATAPHIWAAIVASEAIPVGAKVVTMGFGPGLTATGAIMEKV